MIIRLSFSRRLLSLPAQSLLQPQTPAPWGLRSAPCPQFLPHNSSLVPEAERRSSAGPRRTGRLFPILFSLASARWSMSGSEQKKTDLLEAAESRCRCCHYSVTCAPPRFLNRLCLRRPALLPLLLLAQLPPLLWVELNGSHTAAATFFVVGLEKEKKKSEGDSSKTYKDRGPLSR